MSLSTCDLQAHETQDEVLTGGNLHAFRTLEQVSMQATTQGIGGGITIDVKHAFDSEPLASTFPATVYQQGSELVIHVANAAQVPGTSSIEAEGSLTISTMLLFALWFHVCNSRHWFLTMTEWSIIAYDPVFRSHSLVVFHALTPLLNVEWHKRLAVGVKRNLASASLRNRSWFFEATRIAMYGTLEAAFSGKLPTCSAGSRSWDRSSNSLVYPEFRRLQAGVSVFPKSYPALQEEYKERHIITRHMP
ncbi:hypothetical protein GE21DRAFT_1212883 [Neurospora crassa]|nr:hypothetical protein B1D1.290 [imported] - Neurospora crassa [Neurospora crassa]KHE82690.1 hypothetical protein GE21DRAFT_1212883 [Neurospora crassa]